MKNAKQSPGCPLPPLQMSDTLYKTAIRKLINWVGTVAPLEADKEVAGVIEGAWHVGPT
jgi:hypothetical protein